MPWNLPDDKRPDVRRNAGPKATRNGAAMPFSTRLRQSLRQSLRWLNCFEGGRFRPLRFAVLLLLVLVAVFFLRDRRALATADEGETAGLIPLAGSPALAPENVT